MAFRYVVYDTDLIPPGDRIPILNGTDPIRFESFNEINNRITALEQVKNKINFTNMRYTEIELSVDAYFEIWEIVQDEQGYEYANLITRAIKVNKKIKNGITTIVLESTNPIEKGYIQFY